MSAGISTNPVAELQLPLSAGITMMITFADVSRGIVRMVRYEVTSARARRGRAGRSDYGIFYSVVHLY